MNVLICFINVCKNYTDLTLVDAVFIGESQDNNYSFIDLTYISLSIKSAHNKIESFRKIVKVMHEIQLISFISFSRKFKIFTSNHKI